MLFETLNFIVVEFNAYLERLDKTSYPLIMGNIALQDGQGGGNADDVDDKMVLSLINVEEEKTLKNEPITKRNGTEVSTQNAPLFLNLYLLFSSNIQNYQEALKYLSLVLQFFQQKRIFTAAGSPLLAEANIDKISFEIFDLSFEQTNNLWGVLGSKLVPSILYKVRMITVQAAPEIGAGMIEQIIVNDNSING
ncbi:MAG: DUF4255 domain-containing protein [Phaeodactylibacter sp.]|nr:DUF4255 domain-containing protein [Phaeodactylibacter sp.]MCB9274948.1 DUF4255 domain-containing protein [Lewinellaceae bacterium]